MVTSFCYALHIECVGNAALIVNNGDTLLLFETDPEVKSTAGDMQWYQLPNLTTPIQSGTDYLYPEHGEGYAIQVDGQWEYFWVLEYDKLALDIQSVEAQQSCSETQLLLTGTIPAIQYTDLNDKTQQLTRLCRVSYNDAMWSDNAWVDSAAVVEKELQASITLEASPVPTQYTIADLLAEQLGLGDSIVTDIYQPMAIKAHPQAIVTTRDSHKPNEVDRPIDAETLLRRSAPLDVEFVANGLNTEYYEWNLYQGQKLILKRNEAQHRYTFQEPGNYTMMMTASNKYNCELDSVEFKISVSESMLTVPNTFTPNGDGSNDEFRVVYRSIKEFHMWVYNRWGKLVFKTDNPDKGWDGTINNRPAAEGAYYYVIRALGTDADGKYQWKPLYNKALKKQEIPLGVYQLSGDINLLR